MFRRRRTRPYGGRAAAAPVMESTGHQGAKRTKCAGCGGHINPGDPFIRLRLRKAFAAPCTTCKHTPKRARRFHPACKPTDVNAAMGYNPAAPPPPPSSRPTGAVPPPPKPPSFEDAALSALASLEAALTIRAARSGVTPDLEKAFKTYQGIKARVLRPSTPGEGDTATSIAIQHLVKLVFKQ